MSRMVEKMSQFFKINTLLKAIWLVVSSEKALLVGAEAQAPSRNDL